MVAMTRQEVIGSLRATGSTDPIVLAAAKDEMLGAVKRLRVVALLSIALGAMASLALGAADSLPAIAAVAGMPLLLAGAWALWRAERNVRAVEAGFAEHTGSLPRRITLVRT